MDYDPNAFQYLSPHPVDMVAAAQCYRNLLAGQFDADEANDHLQNLTGGAPFANGFYHGQPGVDFVSGQTGAE